MMMIIIMMTITIMIIAYLYNDNLLCVSRHNAQKHFIMDWSLNYTYKLSKCFVEQINFEIGLERVNGWSLFHLEGWRVPKGKGCLGESSLSKCFKPPSWWIEEILILRTFAKRWPFSSSLLAFGIYAHLWSYKKNVIVNDIVIAIILAIAIAIAIVNSITITTTISITITISYPSFLRLEFQHDFRICSKHRHNCLAYLWQWRHKRNPFKNNHRHHYC